MFPMDLKTFFMAMSVGERDAFAERCQTSRQHITNIAYGMKPCGEKLAVDIDRESGGVVLCDELRPDVDWDHVRNTMKSTEGQKAA